MDKKREIRERARTASSISLREKKKNCFTHKTVLKNIFDKKKQLLTTYEAVMNCAK